MTPIFWTSFAALWVIVTLQGLVLLGVARGLLIVRGQGVDVDKPTTGSLIDRPAPSFRVRDLLGREFDSTAVSGRPRAFLFVSPGCSSCTLTLGEFKSLSGKARGDVYVVCRGNASQCQELAGAVDATVPVLVDDTFEVSELYRIDAVPTAVLVNENDVVQTFGSPLRDGLLARIDDRFEQAVVAQA